MAVDVHPRKTVDQRAAGDQDRLRIACPQRPFGKGFRQHPTPARRAASRTLTAAAPPSAAATSFDRTAAAIGPRAWRALHLTGGYYLLAQFTVSFGKRIPEMPLYALFLVPLLVVLMLRMVAMASKPTARAVQAG
jgi:hypothetical protein